MKKIILLGVIAAPCFLLQAQTVKKPATPKPPVKKVVAVPILKTLNDSASYAIGISVANYYKQMGVKKINTTLLSKAVNDILAGKPALIDDNQANTLMNSFLSQLMAEKSKGAITEGEKFLVQNKLKPGVKTTASGLQYEILRASEGIKPTIEDSVTCHYLGTFLNGEEFDGSYKRGEPITFSLRGVIPGWTEGVQLMTVGSKYKFYVPYQLGYGAADYMSIPGGSMLTFEIELLDVKKHQ